MLLSSFCQNTSNVNPEINHLALRQISQAPTPQIVVMFRASLIIIQPRFVFLGISRESSLKLNKSWI